jgi:hypothetical protein
MRMILIMLNREIKNNYVLGNARALRQQCIIKGN